MKITVTKTQQLNRWPHIFEVDEVITYLPNEFQLALSRLGGMEKSKKHKNKEFHVNYLTKTITRIK